MDRRSGRIRIEDSSIPDSQLKKFRLDIGLTVFSFLFISYAYFVQPYWRANQTSRIALVLALMEEGTVKTNSFHTITSDKAFFSRNYYSDKAPGLSFSALPFAAITGMLLRACGYRDPWVQAAPSPASPPMPDGKDFLVSDPQMDEEDYIAPELGFIIYISTIFTSGLMTAFAALAVYIVSLRLGASTSGALFAMVSHIHTVKLQRRI